MDRLDRYKVDFRAVATGTQEYEWHVDTDFFAGVQSADIQSGEADVTLCVKPVGGAMEMLFHIEGEVQVACDRCLEPMSLRVSLHRELAARWGGEYEDDGESITVPEDTGEVNVAWNIYELISLEVPLRHVHPDGQCSGEVERLLGQYEAREPGGAGGAPADGRWSGLRKILDNNK